MSQNGEIKFGVKKNIKPVAKIDLPGGGQVVVDDGYCYVGHVEPPHGTSIVDIRDPKHPRIVAQLSVPEGIHSHKVQVKGDLMLVNYERYKTEKKPQGGLKVFDISDRSSPREIAFFPTDGVHRFTFDGRYAYFSPELDGYLGNIAMILDLKDPYHPEEIGRWWMPGQWVGGGEVSSWNHKAHRCHHPIRKGNRLYVSYWHGGFVILDISDMSQPKLVSHLDWSPSYPSPTHTALPLPWKLMDREILVVSDEEAQKTSRTPHAFMWFVDITEETRPVPLSTYIVPHDPEATVGLQFGAHQPAEQVYDTLLFVTWFAGGLRAIDIANPYVPKEVGYYVPLPGKGQNTVKSNDVFRCENGLLYLVDRLEGLEILESQL